MHSQAELERIAMGERRLVEQFKEKFDKKIIEKRKERTFRPRQPIKEEEGNKIGGETAAANSDIFGGVSAGGEIVQRQVNTRGSQKNKGGV